MNGATWSSTRLRGFLELAATANPNIVELLFMPKDCVVQRTSLGERLVANRELFISKKAYETHIGYAHSQIKRARGRNKWVNNPQPEEPPSRDDFCRIIPARGCLHRQIAPSLSADSPGGDGSPLGGMPLRDVGALPRCLPAVSLRRGGKGSLSRRESRVRIDPPRGRGDAVYRIAVV